MNVQASSTASLAANGAPNAGARSDAPPAGEPGSFAQVLVRRIEESGHASRADAAPTARPTRTRRPQEDSESEGADAGMLPLIAAALDSRTLAGGSGASGGATAAAMPATNPADALADARSGPAHGEAQLPPPVSAEAEASAAVPLLRQRGDAALIQPGPVAAEPAGRTRLDEMRPGATPAGRRGAAGDTAAPAEAPAVMARPLAGAALAGASPVRPAGAAGSQTETDPAARAFTLAAATAGSDAPAVALSGASPAAAAASPLRAPDQAPELPFAGKGFVAPAVGSRAWGPALGHEVARLHHAGHGQAQLELNPPGLGPLSVTLSVADQQAQALFVSPHPAVRAAVEAALPLLRNALAESGIALGQASVGAEHQPDPGASSQAQQDQGAQRRSASAARAGAALPAAAALPPAARNVGGHAIDTFA